PPTLLAPAMWSSFLTPPRLCYGWGCSTDATPAFPGITGSYCLCEVCSVRGVAVRQEGQLLLKGEDLADGPGQRVRGEGLLDGALCAELPLRLPRAKRRCDQHGCGVAGRPQFSE